MPSDGGPADAGARPSPRDGGRAALDGGDAARDAGVLHDAAGPSMDSGSAPPDAGRDCGPLDLRPYWARAGVTQTYRTWDGRVFGRYRFTERVADSFNTLYRIRYDQGHPGALVTWQKEYPVGAGGAFCTATYGLLFLGDDGSVMEVGDWFSTSRCAPPSGYVAFGYRDPMGVANSGLTWSPPGGVSCTRSPDIEVQVFSQLAQGDPYVYHGYDAYSSVVLLDHLDTWRAPYGRDGAGVWTAGAGRLYTDVAHIVLYHGTRSPELRSGASMPTRCGSGDLDPDWPPSALYQPYANFNSYAMELYLARGVGIVREQLLFTESDYWGAANVCAGAVMGTDHVAAERAWSWTLE